MDDRLHREQQIARSMLQQLEPYGFALGGFGALRAHGISEITDHRVELITTDADQHAAGLRAVGDQVGRYQNSNLMMHLPGVGPIERSGRVERPWITFVMEGDRRTDPDSDVLLTLSTAERTGEPSRTDVGPVQALEDIARPTMRQLSEPGAYDRKQLLIADAIRRSGRLSDDRLFELAKENNPEFLTGDLVNTLEDADSIGADEFSKLGLDGDDVRGLQQRTADWSRKIVASVRPDDQFDPFLADRVPGMADGRTISGADIAGVARRLASLGRPGQISVGWDGSRKPDGPENPDAAGHSDEQGTRDRSGESRMGQVLPFRRRGRASGPDRRGGRDG